MAGTSSLFIASIAVAFAAAACSPKSVTGDRGFGDGASQGGDGGRGGSGSGGRGGAGGGTGGSSGTGGAGSGGASGMSGSGGSGSGGSAMGGAGMGGSGGSAAADARPATGGAGGSTPVDARAATPDAPPPMPDMAAPPRDAPAADAGVGYIMWSCASAAMSTNLTTAGVMDWTHYGHVAATDVNRKANATVRIVMTPLGAGAVLGHYQDRPVQFSWTDGTPVMTATNTQGGVYVDGQGRGVQVEINASTTRQRTAKLYIGAFQARARLELSLTDNSAAPVTDTAFSATMPGQDRICTVAYRSVMNNQKLRARWTVEAVTQAGANVTIQAVTLTEQ